MGAECARARMSDAVQYRQTAGNAVVADERISDWGASGTRLINRGRLLEALDRAVARKVTVISAPAGSGKTSLLRDWAARSASGASAENVLGDGSPGGSLSEEPQPAIAFVSVRREQRDEQLFWLTLLEAIRHTLGGVRVEEALSATRGSTPRRCSIECCRSSPTIHVASCW